MQVHSGEPDSLEAALERLRRSCSAKAVFLVDKNGHQAAAVGAIDKSPTALLASLTVESLAVIEGLAKLVGSHDFMILLSQSESEHIQLSALGDRGLLVVVFDKNSSLVAAPYRILLADQFRLKVERANAEISKLIEEENPRTEHRSEEPAETEPPRRRTRSKVITVANTKGGVGKSTLAVNLAVEAATAGYETLLIDSDAQESAAQFVSVRDDDRPQFQAFRLTEPTLHRRIGDLSAPYDYVFIDVGGHDTPMLRSAIAAADVVVVPMVLSAFDAWASDDILDIIDGLRLFNNHLSARVVLTQVEPTVAASEALSVLRENLAERNGVEILDSAIFTRSTWPRAVGEGLSVVEWEPHGQAASELRILSRLLGIRS